MYFCSVFVQIRIMVEYSLQVGHVPKYHSHLTPSDDFSPGGGEMFFFYQSKRQKLVLSEQRFCRFLF